MGRAKGSNSNRCGCDQLHFYSPQIMKSMLFDKQFWRESKSNKTIRPQSELFVVESIGAENSVFIDM